MFQFINYLTNLNCKVICPILLLSKLVWSFTHQLLYFALNSAIATKRTVLSYIRLSKILFLKFYNNFQKCLETGLVTFRELQNYCPLSSIKNLCIHLKILRTIDIFFIEGSLFNIGRYYQITIMRPGTRVKVFQKDMCNCQERFYWDSNNKKKTFHLRFI